MKYWNGSTGNWSDQVWVDENGNPVSSASPGTTLTNGDDAYISNGGNVTLSSLMGTLSTPLGRLRVENNSSLFIETGASLRFQRESLIANSTVIVAGGLLSDASGLIVASDGMLVVRGEVRNLSASGSGASMVSLMRIGTSDTEGRVDVDGGMLRWNGGLRVGLGNNSTGTMILRNGGELVSSSSSDSAAVLLGGASSHSGVTSRLYIGGEDSAGMVGTFRGVPVIRSVAAGGSSAVIFNHTSNRYEMTYSSYSNPSSIEGYVRMEGHIHVDLNSGVTVLAGASNYARRTLVKDGAVLLANYDGSDDTESELFNSTGSGGILVDTGGILGGIGYVQRAEITGTLKPGDYDYDRDVPTHGILKVRTVAMLLEGSVTEIAINGLQRGVDYSAIDIGTDLVLDGLLQIALQDDFVINIGDYYDFQIFSVAGLITGSFESYMLPSEWNGISLNWDTSQLVVDGSLSVTAIPEPSLAVLALGLITLFFGRRRF